MNSDLVTVIREGTPYHIHENDLQEGDLVLIQTGDLIPADLKLIEARSLEVDEFDITGELIPVYKTISNEDDFLYRGSRVIRGSAKGIVVALGDNTEYGRIFTQPSVPANFQWAQVFHREHLAIFLLLLPALYISSLQSQNPFGTTFGFLLIGILSFFLLFDLIVKFISVIRAQTLIKKNSILIRNFDLLRTMDQIDIICFDKTGVLTSRNIEVTKIFCGSPLIEITSKDYGFNDGIPALIKTACALCNDVSFFEKKDFANPVDHALITFAQKSGTDLEDALKKYRRIYDYPFNSENRIMACGYETENQARWYFMKGDPDIVLNKCKYHYSNNGEKINNNFTFQSEIKALANSISQKGDMAIALAVAEMKSSPDQPQYSFLCVVQVENTLQTGAKEAVQKAIEKGIRPILLTGDKQQAAIKIAHECEIATKSSLALNGNVVEKMTLDEVGRQSEYCSVFSRLIPSQKGTIIRQLQNRGHRVAMIGDGPNDGIALKVANIGISFSTNSSPIAMQYSSVLLNRLSDLTIFLDISNRIMKTEKWLKNLRTLVLLILLFVVIIYIYLQIF